MFFGIRIFGCALGFAASMVFYAVPVTAQVDWKNFAPYDKQDIKVLNGVWRSRGYGWIWHVRDGKVSVFQRSGSYCLLRRTRPRLPRSAAQTFHLHRSGKLLKIRIDDLLGYYHTFDRLDSLPPVCNRRPDPSPRAVFDAVHQIFKFRYAFFSKRKVNWDKLVSSYRPRVKNRMTDHQLFKLLSTLLSRLGDEHVGLRANIDGKRYRFEATKSNDRTSSTPIGADRFPGYWTMNIGRKLLGSAGKSDPTGRITYGLIDNDVGYIHIRSFSDSIAKRLDATLDAALSMFEAAPFVIIDVTDNGGGSDELGQRIAGRFAATKKVGLYKFAGDSRRDRPQSIYVRPGAKLRFLRPVYVITSRQTFSAAETFAMYLSVLPNVTHLGERTAGILSDVLQFRLPNGWQVDLSNEVYLDVNGRSWEAVGVPPKIALEVRGTRRIDRQDRIAAVMALNAMRVRAANADRTHPK